MNWAKNSINKLTEAKKNLGNREGPNVIWLRENEDDTKLRIWDYSLKNGTPTLSQSLNDWEEGLACLAGKPNMGKSTILVNMMMGALQLQDDIIIVDISLDDPYKKRYQQYVACMTGLYYQEITTKTTLTEQKARLKEEAENKLFDWYTNDRLRTIEAFERDITEDNIEILRHFREPEEIFRLMRELRAEYPNKKIAFFIDAWNNLDFSKAKGASDISQANYYLARFQEFANDLGIMVMLSAHLRKIDGKGKPTLEDIKGTSDMSYNVVWAGIVVNQLKERTLKKPLVHHEDGKLLPVVAIEIAKTKTSTVEGELLYVLDSGKCGLKPLNKLEYENYRDKYRGIA